MKRSIKNLLVFLFLVAASPSLAAETLTCTPNQKFHCSPEGCKAAPAKVRAVIDMDKQTYYVGVSPIPLPAALPLFGTGLAIMGFIGWRRRRKAFTAA